MALPDSVVTHTNPFSSLIEVTNDVRRVYHAAFKKARNERIAAKRLNPTLWYAARKEAGHGEYLVRFHEVAGRVYVSCNSVDGERCKGTLRQRRHFQNPMCVHAATVIDRSIQYGQRKQRIESRKEAA